VSTTVEELLRRHVQAGTVPGALALLGSDDAPVVAAGVAAVGGGPMREDAIMRIQSMTKPITSVAALRLVEAGRLGLDQGLEEWLPELADRRVLSSPTAELGDTVPAHRSITLRHLLTNASGYGMALVDSPLQQAMADNGTEAGPQPPTLGAQEWLARLTELPLAFQPGEGWRYHHSFGLLGILITRLTDRSLGQHLAEDLFGPLGMTDTALWVPEEKLDRLPAAYRHGNDGLVETEPAGGGFYAGPASFDVSHGELVSTARDFHRFARMLAAGGRGDGRAHGVEVEGRLRASWNRRGRGRSGLHVDHGTGSRRLGSGLGDDRRAGGRRRLGRDHDRLGLASAREGAGQIVGDEVRHDPVAVRARATAKHHGDDMAVVAPGVGHQVEA